MRRRLLILLLCSVLLLGGCSLAPKYQQPAAPVPETWPQDGSYNGAAAGAEAPAVADLKWEDFFKDDRLKKVVHLALENNRDLRLAALNVERARALYDIQKAELYPAVGTAGVYGKERRSADMIGYGEPRTVEQYSVDLGVAAWEIDFFGRLRNLKDQALEEYLATEEARRSAQIILVAEVSKAYLALAADRENLELSRSTLETQQATYDLMQKSLKNGLATEIDLRRSQTQVDGARRDVHRNLQLTAQAKNALDLLAGTPVPAELLPTDLGSVAPPKEVSPGLSSKVLLERPDIIAAEHQLKGANAFIGAARAAFFPRISLTAAVGTASDELSGLFNSGSDTWSFVPQISMPIFDARTWAALRVSKADQKIILTQYEKTIQVAFREVADALAVQGTINQQVAAQQSLVEAAAEAYRLSTRRYTVGIDNYLSVLDAHRSLYLQQQVLITLQLSRLANRVDIYAALGGGAV